MANMEMSKYFKNSKDQIEIKRAYEADMAQISEENGDELILDI
jgi:hypothetical protein